MCTCILSKYHNVYCNRKGGRHGQDSIDIGFTSMYIISVYQTLMLQVLFPPLPSSKVIGEHNATLAD
jgi:hypothetical protein